MLPSKFNIPAENESLFYIKILKSAVGLGICGGILLGSGFDLFMLSYLSRFPYRLPFDQFFCYFSAITGLFLLAVTVLFILCQKFSAKDKIFAFVILFLVSVIMAFVFCFLWGTAIDAVHDFKRWCGLSHK